jgi:hypothetical protein
MLARNCITRDDNYPTRVEGDPMAADNSRAVLLVCR